MGRMRVGWPLLLAALGAAAPGIAVADEGCDPAVVTTGRVAGAAGGGDLKLEDGRVVRLAAIAADFRIDGHEAALTTALTELALGREVAIASQDGTPDRYGRLAGLVQLEGGESLQNTLVGLGLAAVRPESGYEACATALMPAEDQARSARAGIWERLPLDARHADAVHNENGRFTLVEGRIFAAGTGGNNTYLNFGRIWREDVTVRIPEEARPALVAAGFDPEAMAGSRVLVRGTVEEAGGPLIEVRRAEQMRVER